MSRSCEHAKRFLQHAAFIAGKIDDAVRVDDSHRVIQKRDALERLSLAGVTVRADAIDLEDRAAKRHVNGAPGRISPIASANRVADWSFRTEPHNRRSRLNSKPRPIISARSALAS